MTQEERDTVEQIAEIVANRTIQKLPCGVRGEQIAVLTTKLDNHCNNEKENKENKKIVFDYWKLVLTIITVVILVLQFIKKT